MVSCPSTLAIRRADHRRGPPTRADTRAEGTPRVVRQPGSRTRRMGRAGGRAAARRDARCGKRPVEHKGVAGVARRGPRTRTVASCRRMKPGKAWPSGSSCRRSPCSMPEPARLLAGAQAGVASAGYPERPRAGRRHALGRQLLFQRRVGMGRQARPASRPKREAPSRAHPSS